MYKYIFFFFLLIPWLTYSNGEKLTLSNGERFYFIQLPLKAMELQQLNQHTFLSLRLRSWSWNWQYVLALCCLSSLVSRKSEITFKNLLDCSLSWELVTFFKYVCQFADSIGMNKIRDKSQWSVRNDLRLGACHWHIDM